jgi:hypothetical protein
LIEECATRENEIIMSSKRERREIEEESASFTGDHTKQFPPKKKGQKRAGSRRDRGLYVLSAWERNEEKGKRGIWVSWGMGEIGEWRRLLNNYLIYLQTKQIPSSFTAVVFKDNMLVSDVFST